MSFNTKGLTDPSKAVAIKKWLLDNSFSFDFICLQEIKCEGKVLEFNLKRLNPNYTWFSTAHENGRGGSVIGINPSFAKEVVKSYKNKSWVCVEFGGELNFSLVSVYAPCNPRERALVWEELSSLTGNLLLCGDFNMVAFAEDRHLRNRYVLYGLEEGEWSNLAVSLDLTDMSQDSGFTWNNKQIGENYRAARLDRFYMSDMLLERWPHSSCQISRSTQISDHYPLILKATADKAMVRSGWFHADPVFFDDPKVREDIHFIFRAAFNSYPSPAKAWSVAVSQAQQRLAHYMRLARERRGAYRKALELEIKHRC